MREVEFLILNFRLILYLCQHPMEVPQSTTPVSLPSPNAAVNNLGISIDEFDSISSMLFFRASMSKLGSLVTLVPKSLYVAKKSFTS